jgi:hypothetical protein
MLTKKCNSAPSCLPVALTAASKSMTRPRHLLVMVLLSQACNMLRALVPFADAALQDILQAIKNSFGS